MGYGACVLTDPTVQTTDGLQKQREKCLIICGGADTDENMLKIHDGNKPIHMRNLVPEVTS